MTTTKLVCSGAVTEDLPEIPKLLPAAWDWWRNAALPAGWKGGAGTYLGGGMGGVGRS